MSSIVCYLTGLSHIDPIANDLFLGRFLNEELNALPDIDLDFPRDVREKLIPRVHDRYGKERSALVAAFPTFRSRGAIRELGKVLGLPPGELERVARGAEPWAVKSVGRDVEVAMGMEPSSEPGPFIDPDARADGVRDEHGGVAGDGQRQAAGPGRGARDRSRRRLPTTGCRAAGRGWRGCATRPTGCRAISPSTRAG